MPLIEQQLRARLSYEQIQKFTGWKDHVMVNDYLGISAINALVVEQIDANTLQIKENKNTSEQNSDDIQDIYEIIIPTDVSVSAPTTTSGNMFIEVQNSVLITLNPAASHNESVTIYRNTASNSPSVTDGSGTDIIRLDQTVISYKFKDGLGWVRGA